MERRCNPRVSREGESIISGNFMYIANKYCCFFLCYFLIHWYPGYAQVFSGNVHVNIFWFWNSGYKEIKNKIKIRHWQVCNCSLVREITG